MSISIITVNYNNRDGLLKTIDSVFPVQSTIHEQIIVDALSNDMTENDWLEIRDKGINFVSEKDNGVYDGMNKGANLAKGDYLLFLNSGDYLADSKKFNLFLPFINKYDLIYANVIQVKHDALKQHTYPSVLSLEYMIAYGLPHQATLISRHMHHKIGGYAVNYIIISDWVFFMEALFIHNATYIHINEIVSVFDGHGMSQNDLNITLIISEQLDYISKRFPSYIQYYKLNSPYVKKYFRRMPRWKRWWKKYLLMRYNKL